MIHPRELNKLSSASKVSDRQIEKDYILTWVLFGIANHEVLNRAMVFKGGTVLKKCYFPEYRFSEDLDFTLLDESLKHDQLKTMLHEVFDWVKEKSNITLQHKEDDVHSASGSSLFYVDFVGPLGGNVGSRDIKIDITRGEKMEFGVEEKKAFINFSDLPESSFTLRCYSLSEVFVEKMVALMGRTEPRDLYDFWYLIEMDGMKVSEHKVEFASKAKHKNQNPEEFSEKVKGKEPGFKRDWETKLKHQIHDLLDFDELMRQTRRYLK